MMMAYYNVFDDLTLYPDAWAIIAYSGRSVGKTYGFLNGCIERNEKFVYLKRLQGDIKLVTNVTSDLSPFKPLVRDFGYNITFKSIDDGIAIVLLDEREIGIAMAMATAYKYKGFDLSDYTYMCLDEFMPQRGERVSRDEGNLLLDMYMTISRDRELRGNPSLKMILFANATKIYCPITDTLQVVDDLSLMDTQGIEYMYLNERYILLHHCPEISEMQDMKIFKGMKNTKWADMAFGGKFAYNDFSRVKKVPLKNMVCHIEIKYNNQHYYVYQHKNNGLYYMCKTRGEAIEYYDMDIEADQRRLYLTWAIMLKNEISDGNMFFDSYSAYNLIYNFTKLYKM